MPHDFRHQPSIYLRHAPLDAAEEYLDCDVSINDAHYSKKSPGVIAKVRYSCSGNVAGSLVFDGYLYKWKPGTDPGAPKATHLGVVRSVGPGSTSTVYIPRQELPGINCNPNHWYEAIANITLYVNGVPWDSTNLSTGETKVTNCP
jgi:hypothetical protein